MQVVLYRDEIPDEEREGCQSAGCWMAGKGGSRVYPPAAGRVIGWPRHGMPDTYLCQRHLTEWLPPDCRVTKGGQRMGVVRDLNP